jgi:hypothetical protein
MLTPAPPAGVELGTLLFGRSARSARWKVIASNRSTERIGSKFGFSDDGFLALVGRICHCHRPWACPVTDFVYRAGKEGRWGFFELASRRFFSREGF